MRSNWALASLLLLGTLAYSQQLPPKLPKKMPGVVDIPHLLKSPVQTVKPQYPPDALKQWLQETVVLDVILDPNGNVETIGCDMYCRDRRPDFVQAAADAVKQWKWNPVLVKGQPQRVRTRVSVDFTLDASSPAVDVCTVLHDPHTFENKVINLSGVVQHLAGVNILSSKDCDGTVAIAENGDATPVEKDAKYACFQQAIASKGYITVRGLIHADFSPGHMTGERLALQRVLQCRIQ